MKAMNLKAGDRHANPNVPAGSYTVETVHVLVGVRYDGGGSDLLQFEAAADVDVTRPSPRSMA